MPIYTESDTVSGQTDVNATLEGDATLRKGDIFIRADHINYDQTTDLARVQGNVYVNRSGNVYQGKLLELYVDAFEGYFTEPTYFIAKSKGEGQAQKIVFIDDSNSVIIKGNYTTCHRQPGSDWLPDWMIQGDEIHLDTDHNIGTAHNAKLKFKDVTLLSASNLDFPITDTRKSGLLAPTIGADNISGLQYSQPYYIDLAPNRDATITSTYWSKRGIEASGEFRFMESSNVPTAPLQGVAKLDYFNRDQIRNESRWAYQYNQTGLINNQFAGGGLGLTLNATRVSDDNYWKDFSLSNGVTVQRLLSNDATLNWSNGTFSTTMRVQRWQTLQDLDNYAANYITPPYDLAPQLNARYQRTNLNGFDFTIDETLSRFESQRAYDCLTPGSSLYVAGCFPNANRLVSNVQASYPFFIPAGYITPKVLLNSRQYDFDQALTTGQSSASVTVPTFSLDSSIVFERQTRQLNRDWLQTLEPRMLYVATPYREQNYLPVYDTGLNTLSFASIFAENEFTGQDRISNSNTLTLGATSRFIDPTSGAEGARFALAQRFRFKDQQVILPGGTVSTNKWSDLLAGASLNLSPSWSAESVIEYNPQIGTSTQNVFGLRYNPAPYRTVTFSHSKQDDTTTYAHVADTYQVSWQWPMSQMFNLNETPENFGYGLGAGRWFTVGRVNYSRLDGTILDSVYGFEFDAGCWLGRIVSEQLQVAEGVTNKRILFQLEFVGFSKVGTSALSSLRNNIPRYEPLRLPAATPSRFENYQ